MACTCVGSLSIQVSARNYLEWVFKCLSRRRLSDIFSTARATWLAAVDIGRRVTSWKRFCHTDITLITKTKEENGAANASFFRWHDTFKND